ncbi:MAG: UDP-glucose/GDP-mannose dehydrogenase family protein [Aigarchaeota archaeon]|nr:UDP-glucose/GDP-mannose dehydrogenase family protein [Aigarchaeota archaeon]MDW8092940.1 UDP-glucose/GDP-mannose dehydrogenase family protein [Nitrososphaerota archaeon]
MGVLGLGYVGLVTAACLSSRGIRTFCYDVDVEKLRSLRRGLSPIFEPGLKEMIRDVVDSGTLIVTDSLDDVIRNTSIAFITVGTPSSPDGQVDLSYIRAVSENIGAALRGRPDGYLVVVKSTVPPGTTAGVIKPVIEGGSGRSCGRGFSLCVNPEFLREGNAVYDTLNPDRIVIGEVDPGSSRPLIELYTKFYGERRPPTLITNHVNAELIKYTNNLFLAMRVSAINMIANVCQRIPGADVTVVAEGVGMDRRIGPHFLRAGLGWGGSCWPKDLRGLRYLARSLNVEVPLIDATIEVNEQQPLLAVKMASEMLGTLRGKRVAVLGLSFKPGTDDIREATSLKLIRHLLESGATVVAYDPAAMENARRVLGNSITFARSPRDCLDGADCCILVTEWEEFKSLTPLDFAGRMRFPLLIDGRRVYDPTVFSKGLRYVAVGLGPRE